MSDLRDDIIAAARAFPPLPYRLDPPPDGVTSIDCSLFVLKVLDSVGAPLNGVRTAEQIRQATVPISFPDVLPGDLLFFVHTYEPSEPPGPDGEVASHIGISLGAGSRKMLDAHERSSSPSAAGVTDISPAYWQDKLLEARRIPALAGAAPTPTTTLPRGVDVASYQGRPDWAQVKAAGYAFGVTKFTEGLDYMNPTAAHNWAGMAATGMKRGGYHWGRPSLPARQQVDFFWQAVQQAGGWRDGDFLVLDAEESASVDVAVWCEQFMDALDDRIPAEACVLYTGKWFTDQEDFADNTALARYALWDAAYQGQMPAPPAPWTKITFWQHSSTGSVPGIVGAVDLDVFNGTAEELAAFGRRATPAPSYAVGPGILQAMTERGDVPASDELFFKRDTRDEWSEAFSVSGRRYIWLPSIGRIFVYDPAA